MIIIESLILLTTLFYILKFKSLILKLILIISWYPLLVLFIAKLGIPMPGLLGVNQANFTTTIYNYAFYSYLGGLLIYIKMLYPLKNKIYNYSVLNCSFKIRFLIFLFCCLSSIPLLNIHNGSGGIQSGTFYLIFNCLLLLTHKKKDLIWGLQLILLLTIISLGERVDSIICIVLLLINKMDKKVEESYNPKYIYIGGFCFFIFLVAIGFWRTGSTFNQMQLLSAIYSQQTVCDVVYVYLTGVSYLFDYGPAYEVLINPIIGIVTSVSSPYYYTNLLGKYMRNPGGGLFCTEGMLFGGWIGVVLYFYLLGLLFKYLLHKRNKWKNGIFILLTIMQCRIIWYGFVYTYKPIILLSFLILIFLHKITLKKKQIFLKLATDND